MKFECCCGYRTDGDTSPSEPISASTEKELATEATEGKISVDLVSYYICIGFDVLKSNRAFCF